MIYSLIFVFGLLAFAQAGVPALPGACPEFKAFGEIDAEKVKGDWFAHSFAIVGDDGPKHGIKKCIKKSTTPRAGGFDEVVTYVDGDGKTQTKNMGVTKIEGTQRYTITGDDTMDKGLTVTGIVLDVDYTNRMVVVFCFSDGNKHGYKVVVYGRGKTIGAADSDKAREVLTTNNITADLTAVEQNC